MSYTQYTLGGNTNQGDAFIIHDYTSGRTHYIGTDDLTTSISRTISGRSSTAFGQDKLVYQVYTSRPYTNHLKAFDKVAGTIPFAYMNQTSTESLTNNYPYTISFGNNMWMSLPARPSTAVAGDVRTSSHGDVWTTNSGVLTSTTGFFLPAVYNADDDRWATAIFNTTTVYYSDNDGTSWSTTTAPFNVRSLDYGNDTWVFGGYNGNIGYSTNNLSTITQVTGLGAYVAGIRFNEYDQKFWLAGGSWNGSHVVARILSSTDGITWATKENGSTRVWLQDIAGDDDGNYIAIGIDYDGAYDTTTNYFYSTDSGESWTAGTLATAARLTFGQHAVHWCSMKRGTPPAGSPPPPTYDVSVDTLSVTENSETITWTITTTGISDGSTLYYRLDPFPTDGYTDFTDTSYTGTVTINSNTATVTRTTSADNRTEGTDTVRLLLKTGGATESDPTVAESDYTTILDTSTTPPPPSKAQPSVTSGATQSGSVPRSVVNTEEFSYSFQLTNSTPYSYTVDLKHKDDFLNESADSVFRTFSINASSITTVGGQVIFPKGYNKDEAPNFNFTLLVDARGAPGTPDEVDFVVSRTPYTHVFNPPSGSNAGNYLQYSVSNPYTITVSGGEPNADFIWQGTNNNQSGSATFNSSGVATVDVYQPNAAGTFNYRVTWKDLSTDDYTIIFTN